MAVRLVIYEDNEVLRSSLTSILSAAGDCTVVGAFPDVSEVERNILELQPDTVILDIELQEADGISAIPIIKNIDPKISIIIYTQFEDDGKLFRSLCAGADGYVIKTTPASQLLSLIKEVQLGGAPLSPSIAKKILATFRVVPTAPLNYQLTKRELEVLKLLIKGYSVKLIAAELNIAFDTSRSHLRNIYHKLHVNCGKEAIAKVLSEKLLL